MHLHRCTGRDIGNGKRLARKSQQKVSQWSHGQLRRYITYKAAMAGITVVLENEAYTSQTCPNLECGHRHKPRGRNFKCSKCGLQAHRDVVGAANILSKYLYGLIGGICPQDVRFVQPFKIEGKKYRELWSHSAQDTGHVELSRRVAVSLAVERGSQKEVAPIYWQRSVTFISQVKLYKTRDVVSEQHQRQIVQRSV